MKLFSDPAMLQNKIECGTIVPSLDDGTSYRTIGVTKMLLFACFSTEHQVLFKPNDMIL